MPCPFADARQNAQPPISVIHDFADLPVLLADDDKKKGQAGNPVVPPGSELPTEDYDENSEDEQRRDKPKDKPTL